MGKKGPSSKKKPSRSGDSSFASSKASSGVFGRRRKLEIAFDPDARREYLTGFAARKRERRAFGLAMQKVKDRKAKLQERKDEREARRERDREAEMAKRLRRRALEGEDDADDDDDGGGEAEKRNGSNEGGVGIAIFSSGSGVPNSDAAEVVAAANNKATGDNAPSEITTFEDTATKDHFGGSVVVTTTFGIPSDDDDNDVDRMMNERQRGSAEKNNIDSEQRYAGSVRKYMAELKGNLPSKRRKNHQDHRGQNMVGGKKKGRHGAASMKGMGRAGDFKMARKVLGRAEQAVGGGSGRKGIGKRR